MDEIGGFQGAALSRAFFDEVVAPLLATHIPGLAYSAGRFGGGSDVLGVDDLTSRDHDWGLRLSLFVPDGSQRRVDAALEAGLPAQFRALPTRFAFTGESEARHHVEVMTLGRFLNSTLGFEPRAGMTPPEWLSLSGQAVLEVTAGPVFADHDGELTAVRQLLEWYPDDVWRYVIASDWIRLGEEMPIMSRAADAGDDLGSRVIAARLAQVTMHLAFMLERRWPPYAKWLGTLFAGLRCSADLRAPLRTLLSPASWQRRQDALGSALSTLLSAQNDLGLTSVSDAVVPFWDRPYLHPDGLIVSQLTEAIADPAVRELPAGFGSVDQRTDNVRMLVGPSTRHDVALLGRQAPRSTV